MTGAMEMRELGRTGLRVSRIGVGMAALGRPGYMVFGHAEDLAGGTAALELSDGRSTLASGAPADLVLWRASSAESLPPHPRRAEGAGERVV